MSTAPQRPAGPNSVTAWSSGGCCGPDAATATVLAKLEAGSWDRVTVVVLGPRGSGRTRILRDVQDAVQRRGIVVLSAAATDGGGVQALSMFQQLLGRATPPDANIPPEEVRTAFDEAFGLAAPGAQPAVGPRRLVDATVNRLRELASASRAVVLLDDTTPGSDDLEEFIGAVRRDLPGGASIVRVGGPIQEYGPDRDIVVEVRPWCPLHADEVLDRLPRPPAGAVRSRLLAQAAGNPLALSELGRQASDHPEWGQPGFLMLPLSPHLIEVFAPGLPDLPSTTKQGLAVAAAARGELSTVRGALADQSADPQRWSSGADSWVRVQGRRLHFRHPMARAAAYHAVSPSRMRLLHRQIAAAVESVAWTAWHRAAGGGPPDESVAAELEGASIRLISLGASRAAIEVLSVAASVTPDAAGRDRRLRMAARLARSVDQPEWADTLDVAAPSRAPDADLSTPAGPAAMVDLLVGAVDDLYRTGRPSRPDALGYLVDDAPGPAGESGRLAADAVDAPLRLWTGALLDLAAHRDVAAALVHDLALVTALSKVAELTGTPRAVLDRVVGKAALLLDETGVAIERLGAAATPTRRAAAVESDAAEALAWALIDVGRMTEAAFWANRIVRSRQRPAGDRASVGARIALAVVDGWTSPSPDDGFARATALFDPNESPYLAVRLRRARGAVAAAAGRHDDAWRILRAIWSEDGRPRHDVLSDLAIGDAAAAAAHTHRDGEAAGLLRQVESRQGEGRSSHQRLVLHRARALLAGDESAELHFRLALEHPGGAAWPHERAIVQLDYAEWLRRRQRAADARPQLLAARDAFAASSMPVWAERAARELATARTPRTRTASAGPGSLTLQQRRIADLAAQGWSDRQIADQLFLSVRTVTTHMTQVFRSLGVQRRMHLAGAIANLEREAADPPDGTTPVATRQ